MSRTKGLFEIGTCYLSPCNFQVCDKLDYKGHLPQKMYQSRVLWTLNILVTLSFPMIKGTATDIQMSTDIAKISLQSNTKMNSFCLTHTLIRLIYTKIQQWPKCFATILISNEQDESKRWNFRWLKPGISSFFWRNFLGFAVK